MITPGGTGGGSGSVAAKNIQDDEGPIIVKLFAPAARSGSCDGVSTERAQSEVLDPLNHVIPSTATFVPEGENASIFLSAHAEVTFTPTMPGFYHLTATFEPVGGRAQDDVLVTTSKLNATPVAIPKACNDVYRLSSGSVVCDGTVFRDGQLQRYADDSAHFVASGEAVWSLTTLNNSAHRYQEVDGGMIEPASSLSLGSRTVHHLIAGEDELLVLDSDNVSVLRASGATIAQAQTFAHGLPVSFGDLLYRSGDRVYVARTRDTFSTESTGPDTEVCAFDLQSPATDAGCQVFRGQAISETSDGIWTWHQDARTLRLISPVSDGGQLTVRDSLGVGNTLDVANTHNSSQVSAEIIALTTDSTAGASQLYIPRRSDHGIVLEHYPDATSYYVQTGPDSVFVSSDVTKVYFVP